MSSAELDTQNQAEVAKTLILKLRAASANAPIVLEQLDFPRTSSHSIEQLKTDMVTLQQMGYGLNVLRAVIAGLDFPDGLKLPGGQILELSSVAIEDTVSL